ncbi:hypothetical protein [Candidatus Arsenophonus nilaparvatae]|nr:hypothetical protein [Candidatus Arsenophonus nilaparvatae]
MLSPFTEPSRLLALYMQSHCSWQPFNVNAGVKGEVEGYSFHRRS